VRPLEPTGEEFRALLTAATDYVLSVVEKLPDAPASDFSGVAELLADPALRRPPPERGRPLPELLDVLDCAAAKGVNSAGPGYLAYIPGSGLVSAAIADLLADVLNRYTGIAFAAPALVALEADLLRWLADLFGLPEGAAGVLTTGGSLATLSALITARHARLDEDFGDGTVYVTEQVHQAVLKSMRLAGFPGRAARTVPVDGQLRMDVDALHDAVAADRRAGRRPFCVVASAGTTNTGTIDPLPAIADVATEEGLWLHVDAAYGGFFQLTDRGRDRLRGVERADSLVLDPHKGLFLPYGTGCLLVRDGDLLRRAHSAEGAHYLQDLGDSGLPDFNDYSPELTRDFRGLRLWLPLHLHGVAAFRAALDEKLDLAELAYDGLTADPHLRVLLRPDLTTLAVHCTSDEDTAELLRRVNAEQRVLLSSTRVNGRYIARLSILNHRTDHARLSEALDALHRHAAALAG
jgi:aromatic-L-amino-acid/L-tryptophan decarboxylase